ncbi:MAG: c-type cytochrome [Rhizomicrobium sp.]
MLTQKFVLRALLVAAVLAMVATAAEAGGNAANGATVFARCAICHNNTKGAGAKIGPDLFGVVGRKAGTEPGFSYSAAMKNAGFVWTNARLDAYIKAPQQVVLGNKMPFGGLPSAGQRADLIAYLDTLK